MPLNCTFKVVKMANFMLWMFHHNVYGKLWETCVCVCVCKCHLAWLEKIQPRERDLNMQWTFKKIGMVAVFWGQTNYWLQKTKMNRHHPKDANILYTYLFNKYLWHSCHHRSADLRQYKWLSQLWSTHVFIIWLPIFSLSEILHYLKALILSQIPWVLVWCKFTPFSIEPKQERGREGHRSGGNRQALAAEGAQREAVCIQLRIFLADTYFGIR